MSLHFQTKNRAGKITGKGFYIALGVCLIAVGVAAWTTYDSVVKFANPTDSSQSNTSTAASQITEQTGKTVSGVTGTPESSVTSKTTSSVSSRTTSKSPSSSPAKQTGIFPSKAVTYSYPVSGAVTKAFSGDNPVYSETLKDWRVHSGIDFSAKNGDAVSAIADGKVTESYKDDLLGNVLVIKDSNNVEARYCGLGDTVLVKKGAMVKAGDKIGSVSTVPCELVEPPHLHLEIKKNNKLINPLSILPAAKK